MREIFIGSTLITMQLQNGKDNSFYDCVRFAIFAVGVQGSGITS